MFRKKFDNPFEKPSNSARKIEHLREKSTELRLQGNKWFSKDHWMDAIQSYKQAVAHLRKIKKKYHKMTSEDIGQILYCYEQMQKCCLEGENFYNQRVTHLSERRTLSMWERRNKSIDRNKQLRDELIADRNIYNYLTQAMLNEAKQAGLEHNDCMPEIIKRKKELELLIEERQVKKKHPGR